MDALYLVPVEQVGSIPNILRGPRYFKCDAYPSGIDCRWNAMDYGFMATMLVYARGITDADHAALILNADVYAWPANLAQSIIAQDSIKAFMEGINIPTDWTTASTTYRELLRKMAGMFQFCQRYGGISGGEALIGGTVTLSTRYRNLSTQQQAWLTSTVSSFGYNPAIINANRTLRQMLKDAGDVWTQPFIMGGMVF